MYEMSSEIVRYGLQCSEKLKISKSDGTKNRKVKVVPTGLPGVENVPTPWESIFTLSMGQLPYTKKSRTRQTKHTLFKIHHYSLGAG